MSDKLNRMRWYLLYKKGYIRKSNQMKKVFSYYKRTYFKSGSYALEQFVKWVKGKKKSDKKKSHSSKKKH